MKCLGATVSRLISNTSIILLVLAGDPLREALVNLITYVMEFVAESKRNQDTPSSSRRNTGSRRQSRRFSVSNAIKEKLGELVSSSDVDAKALFELKERLGKGNRIFT